jgi:hypothetical protein
MKYQAKSWDKPRRVISKIEWHPGELFPCCYFIVTNSRLPAFSVVKVYNGRGDVENRIKEGKNTLRWDKTSCHRFAANDARLKMGFLAYNLLHLIRRFYMRSEKARRSIEWIIMRLIDHHEVDQSWSTDRLSRSVLACPYRIGFCTASPLPGCTRLKVLSRHNFRYGLQKACRIGISEIHI